MLSRFLDKLKQTYDKLMNLPGAPNKIAGGVAVGVAMDFLPIPFISIPISFIVAKLVGLNGLAAALTATMFKVAVPLFYAINIMIGRLILSGQAANAVVATDFELTSLAAWLLWFKSLGQPFLLGALIDSIVAFIIVYFGFKKFFQLRQHKYQQRQTTGRQMNKMV